MSGYVASGRIVHATPRIAGGERPIGSDRERSTAAPSTELVETTAAGTTAQDPIAERWSAARERFSQLTFYLFDPDSWR